MEHHPNLAPSKFPALAKCIHYESKERDTLERTRGTGIHGYMRRFMETGTVGSVPMGEVEWAARGEWLAEKVREFIPNVCGIEHRVSLFDHEMTEISFGTCDVWGWGGDDVLSLVDAKSGMARDYIEQMAFYALALMEEKSQQLCRYRVLFCDSREIEEGILSRELAEEKVMSVIRRVEAGEEPPTENKYCEWCVKRSTCEVWTVPAQAALVVVNDLPLEEQFRAGLARIKEDPVLLGRFLTAWHRAEKLVADEELKDTARDFLDQGKDVEGWKLQHRSGAEALASTEDYRKLVKAASKAKDDIELMKWSEVLRPSVSALRKSGFTVKIETTKLAGTSALVRK